MSIAICALGENEWEGGEDYSILPMLGSVSLSFEELQQGGDGELSVIKRVMRARIARFPTELCFNSSKAGAKDEACANAHFPSP